MLRAASEVEVMDSGVVMDVPGTIIGGAAKMETHSWRKAMSEHG